MNNDIYLMGRLNNMERAQNALSNPPQPQLYPNSLPVQILDLPGLVQEVERIVSHYKSPKHNHVPTTMEFRVCPDSHRTFLQLFQNDEPVGECAFMNAEIVHIRQFHFSPALGYKDIFVVTFRSGDHSKEIAIPKEHWNTPKTLSYFMKEGIMIFTCKTENTEAYLLNKLLAAYSKTIPLVTLDPRSGFVKEDGGRYTYRFSFNAPLHLDLPFAKAALKNNNLCSHTEAITDYLTLLMQKDASLMFLFLIFFVWGTFFSIIREKTRTTQGHIIFLRCKTSKVFNWVNAQFSVWSDQENNVITLSSPHKEFSRALDFSKDRCLVIKADTSDISNRRKKNLDILRYYIKDGVAPSGHPADSLILLAGEDIPPDIPSDILYVFEIREDMIDYRRTSTLQMSSYFLYSLICLINERPSYWESFFRDLHVSDTLQIMKQVERIATQFLHGRLNLFFSEEVNNSRSKFLNQLNSTDTYDDASGNLILLIQAIETQIADGTIRLKKNTEMFPKEELDKTLIFDKVSLLISEELLAKLLPSMFQTPPSGIIFRRMLNTEDVLEKDSGQNSGLQKRIRLKNGCRPHCTAIKLEAALQYSNGLLKEFFITKEGI